MDPRIELIGERLEKVENLIPVASGKGGVGKSLIASTTALITSERGHDVGLLDMDIHGPSAHVILGAKGLDFPEEEKGVLPPTVSGIKFMSTVYYSGDKPSPLRGEDISHAIREFLSITRWGSLDYLFVDMPPGVGNEVLDTIQLIRNPEFLLVTTPSKVALSTVKKLVRMLSELNISMRGVVENMKTESSPDIAGEVEEMGVPHLGEIRFDHDLEHAIGSPDEILRTKFAEDLKNIFLKENTLSL